ncbi:hypothetical protein NY023_12395 [Pseudomonas sp. NBB]|nr:hypothetical protein [Pseudomonas sp. NBB]WOB61205.1 hypothetical protein NY023_12395 [Pseudomonas sp. NBB]
MRDEELGEGYVGERGKEREGFMMVLKRVGGVVCERIKVKRSVKGGRKR